MAHPIESLIETLLYYLSRVHHDDTTASIAEHASELLMTLLDQGTFSDAALTRSSKNCVKNNNTGNASALLLKCNREKWSWSFVEIDTSSESIRPSNDNAST
ncbi:hypothetical protein [Rhodopseudomonas telluris]|uniref:Uncharacterized protein n=1 Tax=Rhodopseudomonas telluris TaxID=644215 RepID=A0ABV6F0G2_9BRAD